jgi:hypothetical protein
LEEYGLPGAGNGLGDRAYGLPRFREAAFLARFPFGTIELSDPDVPLKLTITGWSPFVPGDADSSSLPVAGLEYRFTNTGAADRVRRAAITSPTWSARWAQPAFGELAFNSNASTCGVSSSSAAQTSSTASSARETHREVVRRWPARERATAAAPNWPARS